MQKIVSGMLTAVLVFNLALTARAAPVPQAEGRGVNLGELSEEPSPAKSNLRSVHAGGAIEEPGTPPSGAASAREAVNGDAAEPSAQTSAPNTQNSPTHPNHRLRNFIIIFTVGVVLLVVIAAPSMKK